MFYVLQPQYLSYHISTLYQNAVLLNKINGLSEII